MDDASNRDDASSRDDAALDVERLAAVGLYDPAAPDARATLELLGHLWSLGASIEQMIEAATESRLPSLGADLVMFNTGGALTLAEVAERAGVSVDRALRVRLASGFPSEATSLVPEWTVNDIAGFEMAVTVFGESPLLAFSRVMGAAAARIAEAGLALFLAEVQPGFAEPGFTDLRRAEAVEQSADLLESISMIMSHFLREHLMLAVRRQRAASQDSPIASGTVIGFVDLVGSTEWASNLSLREQADALAIFETAAWEIATRSGGRIVKLIGDEVMFTAADPVDGCRIALDLCAAVALQTLLPAARGAVGMGDVYYRDGDYYGQLVNVVARAVKEAEPGGVVVTTSLAEAGLEEPDSHLMFRAIGNRQLRGIEDEVALHVVTVQSAASGGSSVVK